MNIRDLFRKSVPMRTRAICALGLMMLAAGDGNPKSGGPVSPPAGGDQSSLSRPMLTAHNEVRARAHLPPLKWSDQLAAYAQQWGNTLLARRKFYHRPNSPYGENLFMIKNGRVKPGEVVADWASESRNYSYRSNSCHGMCTHYTQLVWRSTQRVGCAVARGGGNEVWVCYYDPRGNVIGRKPY